MGTVPTSFKTRYFIRILHRTSLLIFLSSFSSFYENRRSIFHSNLDTQEGRGTPVPPRKKNSASKWLKKELWEHTKLPQFDCSVVIFQISNGNKVGWTVENSKFFHIHVFAIRWVKVVFYAMNTKGFENLSSSRGIQTSGWQGWSSPSIRTLGYRNTRQLELSLNQPLLRSKCEGVF